MTDARTMPGLWLEDRRLSLREDLPLPEPRGAECLIRVTLAGICNTDLELVRGYYPFTGVPGHEFVGVVEEGPPELKGRRVVGEINAACGSCPACRSGRSRHCPSRTVLGIVKRDGAFARCLLLPAGNLHPLPDDLPDERAVFTEPLAAALEIQEQVTIGAGDRVLVAGDGKLGQLIARSLALTGCDLLVAGRHAKKLDRLGALGIRTAYPDAVTEKAFDVAVECTGNPEGFALALGAVRPLGSLVMKSTYAGTLSLGAAAVVVDEISIVGSRCGPFEPALDLLADGRVDVMDLVEARYPLGEGLAAFEHAGRPGALKILLEMPEA